MALSCCAVCCAGCLLFGASDSKSFSAFLPVFVSTFSLCFNLSVILRQGLMLFGVGGFGLFMTTFSVATLFPARQGTVLSVFNGAFDCGVVFFGQLQLPKHPFCVQCRISPPHFPPLPPPFPPTSPSLVIPSLPSRSCSSHVRLWQLSPRHHDCIRCRHGYYCASHNTFGSPSRLRCWRYWSNQLEKWRENETRGRTADWHDINA
jgi:hypothetical protein